MNIIRLVIRNLINIKDVEMFCNITSDFKEKLKIFKRNKNMFKKYINSKDKSVNIKFKYDKHIISMFM